MITIKRKKRVLYGIGPIVAFLVFSLTLPVAGVTRIMPLGDSITRGHYGSEYDWGYRQPLYVSLTDGGYNFDFVGTKIDGSFPDPNHEGRDGWKANEILNGRPSAPSEGKLSIWLATYQPNAVLLHIGTNDITAGDQDANEVNSILNCIDDYEDANNEHVTVILALIINRNPYNPATTAFNSDVNNMAVSRIANGDDIIIVDMESALDYPTDMCWDGLHPNDNGYTKMAVVWYNALADCDCVDRFVCSIDGHVLEIDGNTPVPGVFIDANNGGSSDMTDMNGYYELTVSHGWSGTVEPNKVGWTFEPNSNYFNNVTSSISDVNYTTSMLRFSISGHITETDLVTAINDVNISADNGGGYFTEKYGGGSDLTDSNGYYEIVVDYSWTGTVRVLKYAHSFEPNNGREYINVLRDFNNQDYTGRLLPYSISGHIFDPNNRPLKNIILDTNNGGSYDKTDVNGFYKLWVDYNWSGTVTPEKQSYYFDPSQNVYENVLNDYTDMDYMGIRNEDINIDGFIDGSDLWYIVEYWLQENPPAGDFFEDNFIDLLDFARLADVWLIEEY